MHCLLSVAFSRGRGVTAPLFDAEGIGGAEATKVRMIEAVTEVDEGTEISFGLKIPRDDVRCRETFTEGAVAMFFENFSVFFVERGCFRRGHGWGIKALRDVRWR